MSTSAETLKPRLRVDLEWASASRRQWIIRDPLAVKFFHLQDHERAAALLMDGHRTPTMILGELQTKHPAVALDTKWLHQFINKLRQHHLLMADTIKESLRLASLKRVLRGIGFKQQLRSPLAIRIPLIDPSLVLKRLVVPAAILFHPFVVTLWLSVGLLLALLVMRKLVFLDVSLASEVRAIQGDRWLILLACYLIAKSCHECGHALACVYHRVRCSELGVMLLCLAPCLYCDTTDAWKLASKWKRAGIAAAGMYVEIILASLAALVWLLSVDGTVHYVAGSLMAVCSIGTLFINSNPLLKYDGYYILSDVWEAPNLSEQSRDAWRGMLCSALSGMPLDRSRLDVRPTWLIAYALASGAYRLFVLFVILWICWLALVPIGLGFVAAAISLAVVAELLRAQFHMFKQIFRELAGIWRIWRVTFWSTVVLLLLALAVVFPIPSYVRARAVTDFEDTIPLFASETSELVYAADINGQVCRGCPVFQLSAPERQLEFALLVGGIDELGEKLKQLQDRQSIDSTAAYQIPVIQERLADKVARKRVLERGLAGLTFHAPYDGYVFETRSESYAPITAPLDDRFRETKFSPACIGGQVERGELLGWFSRGDSLRVTALFNHHDVRRLELGMPALIKWDSDLGTTAKGTIRRIAPNAVSVTPRELIGDASLVSERNERGEHQPESPHYEVTIEIESSTDILRCNLLRGSLSTVQIETAATPLVQRAADWWTQNVKPVY